MFHTSIDLMSGKKRNFTSPENQDNKQSKMSSSPQFDTTSSTTVASDVSGLQLQQSLLSSNLINEMTKMIITSKSCTDAIADIIENQLKQYENRIKQLEAELKQLNDRAVKFHLKLDDLDQYSKRRDLIIHGIPFTQGEDTSQIVLDLAKSVGVNLDIKDFYATQRLGSRGKQHSSIIVVFIRYSDRQQLYSKRKDLDKGLLEHTEENVQIIADKAYIGEQYVITPRKQPRGRELTAEDKDFSRSISSSRAAIKNINQRIKNYGILGSLHGDPYNDLGKISKIARVVPALCNLKLSKHPIRENKL
ncbi:unnamed protein product [Didymodactylos carnosus]|uniref:DDE Tnp4 domain-containing protein n=1 Tax=Didymodactylos carnosus TaxID=1234261 RepID=A0A814WXM9_9BILA|nr:unnamed protein product [Didymodactylos carnosus]CAF1208448.1 unnamed protein product [Didymodactylos carnosus]CAF3893918.1 unnamed protein product [Didymodactylos carnosus]CAF3972588.1 unnamed protein product [Didymodactylos carnosus]